VTRASEEALFDIVENVTSMSDFGDFVKGYGANVLDG
jgi:hypothetical protein